jgi:hypothetical protein
LNHQRSNVSFDMNFNASTSPNSGDADHPPHPRTFAIKQSSVRLRGNGAGHAKRSSNR